MRIRRAVILWCVVAALAATSCKKKSEWPAQMRAEAPSAVTSDLHGAKGSAVLLVLYAAWCHSCRDELPAVETLAEKRRGEGLRLLAYSLDEDPVDFAEMLRDHPYRFDLVRLAPAGGRDLVTAIQGFGGEFSGAIPYAAVLDRDGALVTDFTGGTTADALDKAVTVALARGAH